MLNLPDKYAGSDVENIARILNLGFFLLPFFLLIVLVRQTVQADYDIAIIIFLGIAISFICRNQFLKGHLNRSVIAISVLFNILLTAVCTLGNGIHDIGLIGFPIIIGFSSIILDFKQLMITSLLSVLGLTWLVLGEVLGAFVPISSSVGTVGDLIVSSLLVIMGGFVAFSLTNNMKGSLKRAKQEIQLSASGAEKLAKETEAKLEIIEEIHRAVIKSLTYIRHLIDFKKNESSELVPIYESLQRKILVIEAAHDILLTAGAPIVLDIKLLVQTILSRYEKELKTKLLYIDMGTNSCFVSLDEAINFGICIIEIVHEADQTSKESLQAKLKITGDEVHFSLSGLENTNPKTNEINMVIDLLTKQLKGTLERGSYTTSLLFNSSHLK